MRCKPWLPQQIEDFVKFPPRQKPASFNLDEVMAKVAKAPRLRLSLAGDRSKGRAFCAPLFAVSANGTLAA